MRRTWSGGAKPSASHGPSWSTCIRDAGAEGAGQAALARRTKQTVPQLRRHLEALLEAGAAVEVGADLYVHREVLEAEAGRLLAALERYHEGAPASPGMTPDELQRASGVPARVFGALVAMLRARDAVEEEQGRMALAGHRTTLTPDQQRLLDDVASAFRQGGARPPSPAEVAAAIGRPEGEVDWAVEALCQRGELVRVAPGILFHRSIVDEARGRLVAHIREKGRLESVDFKYLLDTSRKYAIPLLDYFDRIGVTRRVGYTRYLNERG